MAAEVVDVEVRRAVARRPPAPRSPDRALAGLWLVPLDEGIRGVAATVGPSLLRTLDAIHLATALVTEGVEEFITYDRRLAGAARERGLTVLSPA